MQIDEGKISLLIEDLRAAVRREVAKEGRDFEKTDVGRSSRVMIGVELYDLTLTLKLKKVG